MSGEGKVVMREQRRDAGLSWGQVECGGHPGGRGGLELGGEAYSDGTDGET